MSAKPKKCEECGSIDVLNWAKSKSGIWKWLCPWCINDAT